MPLDAVSGTAYSDSVKLVQNSGTGSETNQVINVTEVTKVSKTSEDKQADNEKGKNEVKATDKQIKDAISMANNKLKIHRTRCEFSYHEVTNMVSIKVFDEETDEVIKEIPPEKTLEMIEKMWELAGLLVDERR